VTAFGACFSDDRSLLGLAFGYYLAVHSGLS